MTSTPSFLAKVEELRAAFDGERAKPVSVQGEEFESLLAVRASKDGYAVRVSEISGLVAGKKIVEVPSTVSGFLGLAGARGVLVPVYSLATLLGHSAEEDHARWLALCGREDPIALAFSEFEGYLRIPRAEICPAGQRAAARTHVTHIVRATEAVLPLVSVPLLRATIQERCRSASKER